MKFVTTINIIFLLVMKINSQTVLVDQDSLQNHNHNTFFENIIFADSVISYDPGAIGVHIGYEPSEVYQNSQNALGKPDCLTTNDSGFVSLGYGGTLIIKFTDNILINGPGADFQVFEVENDEPINVWVSNDNKIYFPLEKTADSNYTFNITHEAKSSDSYKFVKIRDIHNYTAVTDSNEMALGADIDAISALNTVKRIVFKTDSLFFADTIHLSEWGKNKLSSIAHTVQNLSQPIVSINAYSHQKANVQYLSMSTYMKADIIYQYFFYTQELTDIKYQITGKGYHADLKYSIIEILIQPKIKVDN